MSEIERFLNEAAQNSVGYNVGFQDLLNASHEQSIECLCNLDISYATPEIQAKCTAGTAENHGLGWK